MLAKVCLLKMLMFCFMRTERFLQHNKTSKLDIKRKGTPLNSSAISLSIPTKTDRVLTVFTKDGTINTVKVLTLNSENLEYGLLNSEALMAVDFKNDKLKSYIVFCYFWRTCQKDINSRLFKC